MLFAAILVSTVLVGLSGAHSLEGLPKGTCESGKICSLDACQNVTCDEIPKAICVPFRCGCEARFFKYQKLTKEFRDVTGMCFATESIKEAKEFVGDVEIEKQRELATSDLNSRPDVTYKTFVSLNLLASEALEAIAYFLRLSAEKNPTEENLRKFELATEKLRELQGTRQSYGVRGKVEGSTFSLTDFVAVSNLWKILMKNLQEAIEVGSKMHMLLKDSKPETQRVVLMDEDTGETMDADVPLGSGDSIKETVQADLDVAQDLISNEGTFSSDISPDARGWLQTAASCAINGLANCLG